MEYTLSLQYREIAKHRRNITRSIQKKMQKHQKWICVSSLLKT
jgi:hypothetical protein